MIQKVKRSEISDQLVEQLIGQIDPSEILSKDGLFAQLKKKIVEKIIESELEYELGYNKHSKTEKKTEKSQEWLLQ